MKKLFITGLATLALLLGGVPASYAGNPNECTNTECTSAAKAKQSFECAGAATKNAAVNSYNTVKEGTVNVYDQAKEGTVNAYDKVKDGTVNAYDKVKDGTVNTYNKAKDGVVNLWDKTKAKIHNATK